MPAQLTTGSCSCYEIRINGRLDPLWEDWFGGLDFSTAPGPNGAAVTILTGVPADQAALFGVLNRIRDLGLRLISVNPIDTLPSGIVEVNSQKGASNE